MNLFQKSKMKGFRIFGEYVFEYLILTFLLTISLILVIPFVPVYIGTISYLTHKRDDRMLKDLFISIKENWSIILKFTILELITIFVPFLNIYFFRNHFEGINILITILSYIVLFVGIIFLAHGPMIIIGMKVNLRQLIYNCFLFFIGGFINSILAILSIIGILIVSSNLPYLVILLLYFMCVVVEHFTRKNYLFFKARSKNLTVQQLLEKENEDIYFNED